MINEEARKHIIQKAKDNMPEWTQANKLKQKALLFFIKVGKTIKTDEVKEYFSLLGLIIPQPDIYLYHSYHAGGEVNKYLEEPIIENHKVDPLNNFYHFELSRYNLPYFMYQTNDFRNIYGSEHFEEEKKKLIEKYKDLLEEGKTILNELIKTRNTVTKKLVALDEVISAQDLTLAKLKILSPKIYKLYSEKETA